ncbi:hypothetical protein J3Q64DRAFT_1746668 [Phycomyces blakesleeanus]|uniref:Uncharacterized protein n=1 Tax=Phycomyces blakesleeanus TaxID=4837 RepID=A0ABR3AX57_PHYBL
MIIIYIYKYIFRFLTLEYIYIYKNKIKSVFYHQKAFYLYFILCFPTKAPHTHKAFLFFSLIYCIHVSPCQPTQPFFFFFFAFSPYCSIFLSH